MTCYPPSTSSWWLKWVELQMHLVSVWLDAFNRSYSYHYWHIQEMKISAERWFSLDSVTVCFLQTQIFKVSQSERRWIWRQACRLHPIMSNKTQSGYHRRCIDHPYLAQFLASTHIKEFTAHSMEDEQKHREMVGCRELGERIIRCKYSALCNQGFFGSFQGAVCHAGVKYA